MKLASIRRLSLGLTSVMSIAICSFQVNAESLYSNNFDSSDGITKLALTKGQSQPTLKTYNLGGRSGEGVRLYQRESKDWTSILGAPVFNVADSATLKFSFYAPSSTWQYRLQGKFPGLTSSSPHFGGNRDDAPVWNRWSVRLMWLSNSTNIKNGNDGKARPSIYIYDQNRQQGKTGTHHVVSDYFLPKSQWQDVELYVKVNTHNRSTGQAWSNGEVKLYINGELLKTVSNLKLIGDLPSEYNGYAPDFAKITQMAFHNYYGGSKADCLNIPLNPDDEYLGQEEHCNESENDNFRTWLLMDDLEVVRGSTY